MNDLTATTCASVMNSRPLSVRTGETVAKALHLLLANHLLALPIIDASGRYRGMFLKSKLISLLLPAGATTGESLHHISQMPDIGFVRLSIGDLKGAFASIAGKPVETFADLKTPVFRPDSALSSALLQLHRTRNFLPVVERGSDRLVGVISTWDILGLLGAGERTPQPVAR